MKRKLLFVIDSLNIGGAEKSLVSLLNLLDYKKFDVDLLMFSNGGDLVPYLPQQVNILPVPNYFCYVTKGRNYKNEKIKLLYPKIKTSFLLRINSCKKIPLHTEQVVFKSIYNIISPLTNIYDVAIAYSQGMPTYFVANKVTAYKKIAWINTDYEKTQYNKDLDYESYKKIDSIVAVSQNTKDSITNVKSEYLNKIQIILDVVNPKMIERMAEEIQVNEFSEGQINILTVGRLVPVKSYDLAIEVAKLLKNSNYKFKWFIIGEGPERKTLEKLISSYDLNEHIVLLGKKLNPYPYMKNCDIYVQTSIKEGFGLTVCEAKILKKPIVCTNFPTANEIISHNKDGLIVQHDAESIYNGIKKFIDDFNYKQKVLSRLKLELPYNSVDQIKNFHNIVEL
ncbi:glycosyltransferase [Bacillus sp. JJ1609]|uniref:glycosyltransferase n=1 Tax=Bacillus sp. JJ1609 TaxID=3122977 RepID=UPI002FFDEBA6